MKTTHQIEQGGTVIETKQLGQVLKPSNAQNGKVILCILIVAWCFGVMVAYYVVHKPFKAESAQLVLDSFRSVVWTPSAPSSANLQAILNDLGNLGVALVLFALAAVVGRRILRRVEFIAPLEAMTLQTGMGLGIISLATWILGLLGLLNSVLFWLLIILLVLVWRREFRATWAEFRAVRLPVPSRLERTLAGFIAATLLLALIVTLTPTVAWDAQVYHLVAGKLSLARGFIGAPPDNLGLSYPSLMEMVYLAAMTLKDDGATALMHFGFFVLTLAAMLSFSMRYFDSRVGWIAGAILCAVPSLVLVASWPYNDAALAFYAFAAFYALLIAMTRADAQSLLLLAGAYAGFALGEKYTAAAVPIALAAVIIKPTRQSIKEISIISLGVILTAGIWFARNWFWEGNPLYPFFFGGGHLDAFRRQHHTLPSDYLHDPVRLLLVPFEATIYGTQSSTTFDATIGPLLLMLLPLIALTYRREDKTSRSALIFCGAGYGIWLIEIATYQLGSQTRLFFYSFPMLALLAAVTLERLRALDLPQFSVARFGVLAVSLVLLLSLVEQLLNGIAYNPLPYLVGAESRASFLNSRLFPSGYYAAMEFVGGLPPGSRVLFLWEPRDYYAAGAAATQSDFILDAFGDLLYRYGDAASIAHVLRREGFTHVLLNRWGLNFMLSGDKPDVSGEDAQVLQQLLSQYANQIYGAAPLDYSVNPEGRLSVYDPDMYAYALYTLDVPE